jgi:short-subunit dehydrogenase
MEPKIVKRMLITGASSGVGKIMTEYFSKDYHVIVAARRIDRLNKYFGKYDNISIYGVDLSDPDDVENFSKKLILKFGYIPYLINNAGVKLDGEIADLSLNDLRDSFQVNALSPFILIKSLLPEMKVKNFGRIINVTSGAPFNCFPNVGAYSASKAALNALTVTAARENTSFNIKINLMSPGPVKSEMSPDSNLNPEICLSTAKYLLELKETDSTGKFFWLGYEIPLFPNLEGVNWLKGDANSKFKKVFE